MIAVQSLYHREHRYDYIYFLHVSSTDSVVGEDYGVEHVNPAVRSGKIETGQP
jgi:hypothetical protein